MKFYNEEHENFYNEKLKLLSVKDPYRESLFYVLGLMEDTRKHFNRIYDTKEKTIIPVGKPKAPSKAELLEIW